MKTVCTSVYLGTIIRPIKGSSQLSRMLAARLALDWVTRVTSENYELRTILQAMARGEDVWREFLDMLGPFILHILKHDYGFYTEYDEHARHEALHDIYLRVATYADRMSKTADMASYKAYLRKIIRTVMCNRWRILRRWRRETSLEALEGSGASANPGIQPVCPRAEPLGWLENAWQTKHVGPAIHRAVNTVAAKSRDPKKTKLILRHRLLQETPYPEIAARAGMDVDAVRHVVHYYRKTVIQEARQALGLTEPKGDSNAR